MNERATLALGFSLKFGIKEAIMTVRYAFFAGVSKRWRAAVLKTVDTYPCMQSNEALPSFQIVGD